MSSPLRNEHSTTKLPRPVKNKELASEAECATPIPAPLFIEKALATHDVIESGALEEIVAFPETLKYDRQNVTISCRALQMKILS